MNDALGNRIKEQYEDRTRYFLPRRTYTILRLDGRAFHTVTRNLEKPYDVQFIDLMDKVALELCKEVQNTQFAFIQSDEISLLLTDFATIETQPWFNGNIQKMVSVAASIAGMAYNKHKDSVWIDGVFDARVFTIPDPTEVENYFIWRQKDAERNSLALVAQEYASVKELHGVTRTGQHDIIHNAGDNWNDYPTRFKRGRMIVRVPDCGWMIDNDIPIFTEHRDFLAGYIPTYN